MKGSEQEPIDIEDQPRKIVKQVLSLPSCINGSDKTLSKNIARKVGNI